MPLDQYYFTTFMFDNASKITIYEYNFILIKKTRILLLLSILRQNDQIFMRPRKVWDTIVYASDILYS